MRHIFFTAAALALFSTPLMAQNVSDDPVKEPGIVEAPEVDQQSRVNPETGDQEGSESTSPNALLDDDTGPMTLKRMGEIVKALDANAAIQPRAMQLTIADVTITIVADPRANRMRAFTAFKTLDGVDGQQLYRMMQANFDAALDARYAVAKGHVLSVFIHPLAELQKDQFIEGLGQVVNLVKTFGTAYTSGAMTFGGGDSGNLHRELIDDLLKKGEEI